MKGSRFRGFKESSKMIKGYKQLKSKQKSNDLRLEVWRMTRHRKATLGPESSTRCMLESEDAQRIGCCCLLIALSHPRTLEIKHRAYSP